ncbi:cysteine proteinase inhibitor 5-like [Tasmannia lanceolata]|uniref:cysteine proteinase inhibitor 5-like n=1 Tax=Tasmannia lanceolata TaxID=3420 RepID=UPI0040646171
MKIQSFFLLFLPLLVLLPLIHEALAARDTKGSWEPINPNDTHIKEIGEYAVSEYDKTQKASLMFKRVVSGESQVVAGMNYRLVIEAMDKANTNTYQAVVYERPWEKFRNLTSFKQLK